MSDLSHQNQSSRSFNNCTFEHNFKKDSFDYNADNLNSYNLPGKFKGKMANFDVQMRQGIYNNKHASEELSSMHKRKNASRETTCMLKAWLNEHRKNPYPSKGEKVMLAIITKMTLTQVSTWFANARRRLKKENKMTWIPRHRSNEQTEDDSGSEISDLDEEFSLTPEPMSKTSDFIIKELNRLEEMTSSRNENDLSSNSSSSPRPLQQISPLSNNREEAASTNEDALSFIRQTFISLSRQKIEVPSAFSKSAHLNNINALANTALLLAKSISGSGDFVAIPAPNALLFQSFNNKMDQ